jgi:hypothetical protein
LTITNARPAFDRSPANMRRIGRLHKKHYDWDRISQWYVMGTFEDGVRVWPTLDHVARVEQIRPERVRLASARAKWVAQRQQFRHELAQAARNAAKAEAVEQVADTDFEVVDGSYRGVRLVNARIHPDRAES